jgi:nucleoside-diphosphate-sugar epimerase
MDLGTRRVLVTGTLGWLGTALLQALVRGVADVDELRQPDPALEIRGLVVPGQRPPAGATLPSRIELVEGDVRHPADCTRLCVGAKEAVLFHTAGVIHPRQVREFYDVNVEGTRNVLAAAIAAGVRRAVVVSSSSACGSNPHPDHRFDESSPHRPYMHYGRSKMLMECAVEAIGAAGAIETVVIRAPWFYGPWQPPRQTLFFRMVRDGKAPIVGGGTSLRSMAYVDNVCQGLLLAAAAPRASGQLFWIADARSYPMYEIVDTVERLLETEFGQTCAHRRLRLPGFASDAAWLADRVIQAAGFYQQRIHVLSEMNKTIACAIDRAERELGYAPRVGLEEGMRRSLRWLFEHDDGISR